MSELEKLIRMQQASSYELDDHREPLGKNSVGHFLSQTRYSDLYQQSVAKGTPCFYRLDRERELSFVIMLDQLEDFEDLAASRIYLEWQTYRRQFISVIWTEKDPKDPLGYPVVFNTGRDQDVYALVRFLQQDKTPIHYLAWEQNQLLHIFTEAISFSQKEKENAAEIIIRMIKERELENREQVQDGTARLSSEVALVPSDQISDTALCDSGRAYLFDYHALFSAVGGEEQVQQRVAESLLRILQMIQHHSDSSIREQALMVWTGEIQSKTEMMTGKQFALIVTPAAALLKTEDNPFDTLFCAFPEYTGQQTITPLHIGAFPVAVYLEGKLVYIDPDQKLQSRLHSLWQQQNGNDGDNDVDRPLLTDPYHE